MKRTSIVLLGIFILLMGSFTHAQTNPTTAPVPAATPVVMPFTGPVPARQPSVYLIPDDGTLVNKDKTVNTKAVAKKFYQRYSSDAYDFIALYTTFPNPNKVDFFEGAQQDIKGIGAGRTPQRNVEQYGSAGKLKGVAVVHGIDKYANSSGDLLHELSHYWLVYVNNFTQNKNLWILADPAHWSQFMDTATRENGLTFLSPNGGAPWRDNRDGSFTVDFSNLAGYHYNEDSSKGLSRFNTLELYLMGLLPKSEATPLTQIIPDGDIYRINDDEQWVKGKTRLFTIDDLIALAGEERNPAYPNAQKDFSVAFILLTEKGKEPTEDQINKIHWIAGNFPKEWNLATGGRSTINKSITSSTPPSGGTTRPPTPPIFTPPTTESAPSVTSPTNLSQQTENKPYTFNHNLAFGLRNNKDVTALQKILAVEKLYTGPITGNFFQLTFQAVKKFQKKYQIRDTGFVGHLTRKKLNELSNNDL